MPLFDGLVRMIRHLGFRSGKLGNVVFIPGILGSDLADQRNQALWIVPPRLDELFLKADGVSESDPARAVHPTKPNFPYDPMLKVLELSWNVLAFAYDWRRDIVETAQKLEQAVRSRFHDSPFHIVAHSMGGLVARALRARVPGVQRGGKLVMLGTPNHGNFLLVHALTADTSAQAFLQLYGVPVQPTIAMAAVRTWPGAYQMLPCPKKDPTIQPFYDNPPAELSHPHMGAAARFHALLHNAPSTDGLFYIAGSLIPTIDGRLVTQISEGDGVVSHRLGFLEGATTFKVLSGHVALPSNPIVLASITPLLHDGSHGVLLTPLPG